MNIAKDCKEKMIKTLKDNNKLERRIYSTILNALNLKAKELRREFLTEEEEIAVIEKLLKQTAESICGCPNDRVELLKELNCEREILNSYMPKQLTKEEIVFVIKDVLKQLGISEPKTKDFGSIMKVLSKQTRGRANGKVVSDTLKEYLTFLEQYDIIII